MSQALTVQKLNQSFVSLTEFLDATYFVQSHERTQVPTTVSNLFSCIDHRALQ